jgi:hypothetical protein
VGVKNAAVPTASHAHHDRALVARFAADDAYPGEVEQARQLVDRCSDCAAVARDIRQLTASLAAVSAPARTRDFRLTDAQAEQLRGGFLDRVLRRFASPGLGPVRPLAGVALSIGLAFAVAGAALPTPADVALQMAPQGAHETGEPAQAPAKDGFPTYGPAVAEPGPQGEFPPRGAEQPDGFGLEPGAEAAEPPLPGDATGQQRADSSIAQEASAREVMVIGGLLLALLSLGALALVIVARRRFEDPLLR